MVKNWGCIEVLAWICSLLEGILYYVVKEAKSRLGTRPKLDSGSRLFILQRRCKGKLTNCRFC